MIKSYRTKRKKIQKDLENCVPVLAADIIFSVQISENINFNQNSDVSNIEVSNNCIIDYKKQIIIYTISLNIGL